MLQPRIRIGGQTLSTFTTMLRFDTARDITLSELRIELIFPADDATRRFFERAAAEPTARDGSAA